MNEPRPELMALLAACKQQPDDDAARLVLADWLEEHGGEPERARAQVIRLQLAEGRGGVPYRLTVEGLVRKHTREWLGPVRQAVRKLPDCERGLLRVYGHPADREPASLAASEEWAWVESVSLGAAPVLSSPFLATVPALELTCHSWRPASLRGLAEALTLDHFRSLKLNWWIHELPALHVLLRSPRVAGLQALAIVTCPLGPDGAAVLADSESLAGLRKLSLNCAITDEGAARLAGSTTLRGLRALSLFSSNIMSAGLVALCEGPGLAALRSLSLSHNDVGDGIEALGRAPFRESLEELCLAACGVTGGALRRLPTFPRLRRLSLTGDALGVRGVADLAAGSLLHGLESLRLSCNPLGPKGVASLVGCGIAPTALHLDNCLLGDQGAARLAAWPGLANVEWLSLGNNSVGPEGARALAESPHTARLTALDLSNNPLEARGAEALTGSPLLARLCWLSLVGAQPPADLAEGLVAHPPERLRELLLRVPRRSHTALTRLRRALPQCVIG